MTSELQELFRRGAQRGYILASELAELHDPIVDDHWMEAVAQRARDLGLQVVDRKSVV